MCDPSTHLSYEQAYLEGARLGQGCKGVLQAVIRRHHAPHGSRLRGRPNYGTSAVGLPSFLLLTFKAVYCFLGPYNVTFLPLYPLITSISCVQLSPKTVFISLLCCLCLCLVSGPAQSSAPCSLAAAGPGCCGGCVRHVRRQVRQVRQQLLVNTVTAASHCSAQVAGNYLALYALQPLGNTPISC